MHHFKSFLAASVTSAIIACTSVNTLPAFAEFKVATVDVNQVLNASTEAKSAKASLDTATQKAKKLIEDKKAALKPLEDQAKAGKIVKNSKEAEQLQKQSQELIAFIRDKEDELRKEFMKSNKTLTEKTVKLVESYAKDNNIDLVLDKSEQGRSAVLFGDTSFDITNEIIKRINN